MAGRRLSRGRSLPEVRGRMQAAMLTLARAVPYEVGGEFDKMGADG
jgi:hypothetical protein